MPNRVIRFFLGLGLGICLAFTAAASEASDLPNVEKGFEVFCKSWMRLKNDFAVRKMQCRKDDQGYIAEYNGYSETFSARVKVSDPVKKVYVGILAYKEIRLQRQGKTQDAAKKGPFYVVSQLPVKEIFLYRDGKWLD